MKLEENKKSIENNNNFDDIENNPKESSFLIESDNKEELHKFKKNISIIDQILDKNGIDKIVLKSICLSYFFMFNFGMLISIDHVLFDAIKVVYKFSDDLLMILSSSFNLSIAFGLFLLGYITSYFNRYTVILFSVLLVFLVNLINIFIINIYCFAITRLTTGIMLGYLFICFNSNLIETLPNKFRGMLFCLGFSFISFGGMFVAILENVINLDTPTDKKLFVIFICILQPIGILVLLSIFLFKESFRNLIVMGNEEKAQEFIFEILNNNNQTLANNAKIVMLNELNFNEMNKIQNSFKSIFSIHFTKFSIIIFFLVICLGQERSGPNQILLLLHSQDKDKINIEFDIFADVYRIIDGLIGIIGVLFSCIIIEMRFIGRKFSLIMILSITTFIWVVSIITRNKLNVFVIFMNFFNSANISILMTLIFEIYPTKIRDISTGYQISFLYLSLFFSTFIFKGLYSVSELLAYMYILLFCIISLIISFFIQFETIGTYLDNAPKSVEENNYLFEKFNERSKTITISILKDNLKFVRK